MKAVVVAHGEALPADRDHALGAELLIAADGGALQCSRWGLVPQLLIGDLDSVGVAAADALRRAGVRVERHPADKDESDTELALHAALAAGATEIVLLAAFGGDRLDHELANLLLLADVRLGGRARAVRGGTTVRAIHGGTAGVLQGAPGDLVTLLPLGEVTGVVTDGLRYPLRGETLRAGAVRGLSNVIEQEGASVALSSGVLITIEIAQGGTA